MIALFSAAYNEKVWWYVSRSSGIVALALLAATQVWGVMLSTRRVRVERPAWLLELHRWLGGTALIMTIIHVGGLMLDGYVDFGWMDVAVPGAASYRPLAVAIGVVSTYFIIAIQLTSYLRTRMPRRVWRAIHMTSYVIVWTTGLHAWLAGTDTSREWYRMLMVALAVITALGLIARLVTPRSRSSRTESPRSSGSARGVTA